ncbi:hypothetical protein ECZU25_01380 [Escherichia coli]|nr:hypothetical protein ECZU25_01380 [Escherichia coli]
MKTSTIPTLLGPDGMTSLREYAGYHGGGSGFGGQLRAWNPPGESVDAALLPNFTRGNARADDLVRNNGYAANAIQLHQDHIVGSFFRLSHRPSWRYLGIGEEEARAFSREVEAAWKEFAEDDCCCIDVERKRTFTMMIREGVAMHAFNGELFVQATWDTSSSRLFRTQFRMVSPKRISNPNNTGDSRNCRAGVQINDSGAALGYYVSEDGYPGWMPQKWTWIPRELPGGRASFIHVFEPVEDGQTRGANVFYSVMEQMKMLDTLQNTQLQSAIVKAMYAATIESELDTQSAMDFILGANSQEQRERLTGWIGEIAAYYAAAPVRLGGAKVPHLMPGDSLNLQTAQDTDNGYSVFEQSLLRYIAAGLGVSYEQLSRNYAQMSYSTARASANESWAHFMGRRKFVASRQASQMFLCWLEEAIVRRVVTLPSKARFSFQEARSAWGNCDWIGSGRMAIDGLKEVQEAVMLIEAGLSTYEKECAKRGDDYQEIFAQQVRETMERRAAGLKPPARRLRHLNPGCDNQQRRRRVTAELRNLPHIASMAFNEPLMLEPAYARVFFCALAGQLGISRLTDAVSGDSLTAGEAPAALALSVDDDGPRQARSYQVMNGIAVLPVSGTLVSRTRALQPYSGMTGYNGIIARLQQAASDPMVDGILLDMDTPGGMVAGAFDCADIIARVRDIKPVWALANDMNCSAGQLLASAASRRLVTQTARTGSIGVMMAHSNYGAALEKQGVEITLIYSGSHKVDGNPYSHLPDDVRETLQSRMDATRRMFAQKVSAYTGLSVQAVLDTEAAVYSGQEAIDAGLADELVNSTDAITVMRDALDARKSRLSGGRMTKETQSTTVSATASQADVTEVVQATEGENASAAQPDVNAQITAAVAAENSRIMGILNCEEAHGREEQARVLAETPV